MIHVEEVRIEGMTKPMGLDMLYPRFSWSLIGDEDGATQTAYRIMVASSDKSIVCDKADMWDSGKTTIDANPHISYEGKELQSSTRYYGKLCVWDEKDCVSQWSGIFYWETGLLRPSDWLATWIGATSMAGAEQSQNDPAPLLRKAFQLKGTVCKGSLYISGLGYYEAYLNGTKIGDRVLEPAPTNYEQTVLYSVYDVTSLLCQGRGASNAIGIWLGRGRYAQKTENVWGWENAPWHDAPKLLCQLRLDYEDGSTSLIMSNITWKTAPSPLRLDCLYAGEVYDAREEISDWALPSFNDEAWTDAIEVAKPSGMLRAQWMQPIKVMATLRPVHIRRLKKGRYVFDFGKMLTGWVRLRVSGEQGSIITLSYGEVLSPQGSIRLEQTNVQGEIQVDKYILKGKGVEEWKPRFSYKGFQYVELDGAAEEPDEHTLEAEWLYTAVESCGTFSCSNSLLERIHENTRRAIVNNLHGVPTDTPVYEKNGWTCDAMLTAEAAMCNYRMAPFYTKWMQDFQDAMRDYGELPPIVPTSGWGYEDSSSCWDLVKGPVPAWDAAFLLIPRWYYWQYGDSSLIERHYDSMKKFVGYLEQRADGYILNMGLGDWLAPSGDVNREESNPPEGPSLISTAYYYKSVRVLQEFASLLSKHSDARTCSNLADRIFDAFQRKFYDPERRMYRTDAYQGFRQTSNVIPLAFGLVPAIAKETILNQLVDDIVCRCNWHLDTGILGTKYLLPLLTEHGYVDLAYAIANQSTYPSWGFWLENGATSLWEAWEAISRSRNHHMFGSIDEWFYQYLAGIRPEQPGYRKIRFQPYLPAGLERAGASIQTVAGSAVCQWVKTGDILTLELEVPVSSTASLYVPESYLLSSSVCGGGHASVKCLGNNVYLLESGHHKIVGQKTS